MLFNEPKLLKSFTAIIRFVREQVSVLFNEPKLLKSIEIGLKYHDQRHVSVLFNEPKLLKYTQQHLLLHASA